MALTKIVTPELFNFSATNTALQLPTGDTASRPTNASAGEWRFNSELKYVEYYDGTTPYDATKWFQIDTEATGTTCDCDYPTTSNGELLMQLDNSINNTCSGVTPTMASGTATFSSTAKYGSYSFQGDGSRCIDTNYSLTGKSNYTISIWFYNVNTGSSSQYIGGTTGTNVSTLVNGWLFNVRGSSASTAGYIDVIFRGGSSAPDIGRTIGGTTANDTWNNLCVAYDNGTATIYLNGSSSFSLTGGTNPQTSLGSGTHEGDLSIASGGVTETVNRWTGLLDQVRVYDSTLTQTEITSLQTETPC